jgi:hypothetical protein
MESFLPAGCYWRLTRGEIPLSLLSTQALSENDDIRASHGPSSGLMRVGRSCKEETPISSPAKHIGIAATPLRGEQSIREAVLLLFCDPLPQQCLRLEALSLKQWMHLLRWLDFSGLALYFLDRIVELGRKDLLPVPVLTLLQQRLSDNTKRTDGMTAESIAIQEEFQNSRLSYAILKGLSLWPSSVPRPGLRSQFDLDFLVGEECAPEARTILECRGYRLYAISGNSWEFKRNEIPGLSLKDMYKDLQSWTVELHVEPALSRPHSPLERLAWRDICGYTMPTLCAIDLFTGQGLHTYKHICGEFLRAAHLVEFRRHVLFRREDNKFWSRLYHSACENRRISVGLGIATLLITQVTSEFAPDEFTRWTVRSLPASAHLWCQRYGYRVVLGSFPGSKLYLLLQRELDNQEIPLRRSIRQSLLPSRLPPPVIRAFPNETLSIRFRRYRMHFNFIVQRLRFHLVEGLRFTRELRQWRRNLKHLAR